GPVAPRHRPDKVGFVVHGPAVPAEQCRFLYQGIATSRRNPSRWSREMGEETISDSQTECLIHWIAESCANVRIHDTHTDDRHFSASGIHVRFAGDDRVRPMSDPNGARMARMAGPEWREWRILGAPARGEAVACESPNAPPWFRRCRRSVTEATEDE